MTNCSFLISFQFLIKILKYTLCSSEQLCSISCIRFLYQEIIWERHFWCLLCSWQPICTLYRSVASGTSGQVFQRLSHCTITLEQISHFLLYFSNHNDWLYKNNLKNFIVCILSIFIFPDKWCQLKVVGINSQPAKFSSLGPMKKNTLFSANDSTMTQHGCETGTVVRRPFSG